jgi:hypothetical protein
MQHDNSFDILFINQRPEIGHVCFLTYFSIKENKQITRKGYITSETLYSNNGVPFVRYYDLDKEQIRCFHLHNFVEYKNHRVSYHQTLEKNDLIKLKETLISKTAIIISKLESGVFFVWKGNERQKNFVPDTSLKNLYQEVDKTLWNKWKAKVFK